MGGQETRVLYEGIVVSSLGGCGAMWEGQVLLLKAIFCVQELCC